MDYRTHTVRDASPPVDLLVVAALALLILRRRQYRSSERTLSDRLSCCSYRPFATCGRAHDSEAEKYHGALYKGNNKAGKKSKSNGKTVTIVETPVVPRKAYVEDVPEYEGGAVAIVDAPPHAPSPPPAAAPAREQAALPSVNVFDFLVTEDTPNASRVTLAPEDSQIVSKKQMRMKDHAPGVFETGDYYPANGLDPHYNDHDYDYDYDYDNRSFRTAHDNYSDLHAYEDRGYSYGADPIPTSYHDDRPAYLTPAPRRETERVKVKEKASKDSRKEKDSKEHKKDKKRKRHPVEELDLSASRPSSHIASDSLMEDAPPVLLHSGLTGGLNRLLSKSDFPPSPDYSGADAGGASPHSPLKRSKHTSTALTTKDKKRATTLVKTRKPSSSSQETETERRPRKHHRHHHHHRSHRSASPPRHKKLKAIEYHQPTTTTAQNGDDSALILYRSRAELFMSFINKGPNSEKGLSVNKALKRYHRERGDNGVGLGKGDEEKELWKGMRMRRNDRGEIVLFA
ncbi:MAG: hypothetical protein M1812_007463 [Candelaria pacifica]|nr:MAG: hypothetical protein M1812_007463 [Candelaria pacifica]